MILPGPEPTMRRTGRCWVSSLGRRGAEIAAFMCADEESGARKMGQGCNTVAGRMMLHGGTPDSSVEGQGQACSI